MPRLIQKPRQHTGTVSTCLHFVASGTEKQSFRFARAAKWNHVYLLREGMDGCADAVPSRMADARGATRVGCTDSRIRRALSSAGSQREICDSPRWALSKMEQYSFMQTLKTKDAYAPFGIQSLFKRLSIPRPGRAPRLRTPLWLRPLAPLCLFLCHPATLTLSPRPWNQPNQ